MECCAGATCFGSAITAVYIMSTAPPGALTLTRPAHRRRPAGATEAAAMITAIVCFYLGGFLGVMAMALLNMARDPALQHDPKAAVIVAAFSFAPTGHSLRSIHHHR